MGNVSYVMTVVVRVTRMAARSALRVIIHRTGGALNVFRNIPIATFVTLNHALGATVDTI